MPILQDLDMTDRFRMQVLKLLMPISHDIPISYAIQSRNGVGFQAHFQIEMIKGFRSRDL